MADVNLITLSGLPKDSAPVNDTLLFSRTGTVDKGLALSVLRDYVLRGFDAANVSSYKNLGIATTSSFIVNPDDAILQTLQLTQATTTISFKAVQVEQNTFHQVTLLLSQGTGANKVTWPSSVKWNNGRTPTLSYNKNSRDIFNFVSYDNGTTWLGTYVGGWFD